MKAELYVQGAYWTTVSIPGDAMLTLLQEGIALRAQELGHQLQEQLANVNAIACSISVRFPNPAAFTPGTHFPKSPAPKENTHAD